MRRTACFTCAALLAAAASARVEIAWSEAFAAPLSAATNGLSVKTGDQHVLHFSNGVVRAHHLVTDRWFDLQPAPFAACSSVERLDDGRLLVVDAARERAVYGTFGRTKAYHPVNWAVIAAYLLLMAGMGVWFMRRNKSSDDYFRAGGRVPWIVVSMSIYATMFSSITFLSIPALTYLTDCRYFIITFGIVLMAPVVVKWYLPFFRKLNLTSAYEFLEVRFNLPCRLFASAAFILFMVARTAIVTYLPALAIAAVTDLDVNTAIVAVTAVTIFYCTIGGVEAVIWSDFVQSIILIASTALIYALLVLGTDGGLSGFISAGAAAGKFRAFDFALDWSQPCFWVVLVGGIVANLASYTSDQCVVQRYMTTKDERGAAKSIMLNGVLSFFNCMVFFTMGVALWTFYRSNPGLLDVTMPKNDSVLPLFIGNDLPVGVSGIVLAAVAAATMSTLSANLNSAASAIVTDFCERLFKAGERSKLLCGKISTVAVGLLGGGFALVLANMEIMSIYDQFQRFLGVLTGGLGCLFFMGVFMKRVNGVGATAGLAANYAVCFALDQMRFAGKPHLLLYGFLGMVACLIVAPVASRLGGKKACERQWRLKKESP
ncbi:MAG: sodium:solute symporter [Kiritimatiellae bacterium]|nr:sodium:solute symporter [Kiritimatiellia bacterium]